jgi:2-methylisocitrate lyase-like PEP mutase family enzyme
MSALRDRLNGPTALLAIGAHDPLTALIAQRSGFEAVYHGGYAVSAHQHGLPDIGLVGLSDISQSVRRITAQTTVPVIVDADTGYGAEAAVRNTVGQLEAAGAAAIQLEDQVAPKRCGHMEGKRVVEPAEMVAKVHAAVEARTNPDTVLIARTDALAVHGLADAIERVKAYAEAGADVVFVDAPRSRDDLEQIAGAVTGVHLMANMVENGKTPLLTADELTDLGYALVIYPASQTWLFVRAYRELCDELLRTGTTSHLLDRFEPFEDVNRLLGRDEWEAPAGAPEPAWSVPGRDPAAGRSAAR